MNAEFEGPRGGDALIVADIQEDFLPGGALGVAGGNAVIAPINRYAAEFKRLGLPVFATRDWHPPDHCSFRERGGPWPPHCVAGSPGAQFSAALALPAGTQIVSKATQRDEEAYSAFEGTDLAARLREKGTQRVFLSGLATDYCVRATALDALKLGLGVVVLEDAICGIDVQPGDSARALAELAARGVQIKRIDEVLA